MARQTDLAPTVAGRHIPALDGIRGIAILLVMLHHFTIYSGMDRDVLADRAFVAVANVGWTGVDLFFVLSGFLITGILLDARGGPNYFRHFYARRFLRIFPLYYGFLVLVFLVMPRVAPTDLDLEELLAEQGWYWSYLVNFQIALEGWPSSDIRISHFWSLAVEEQFYLFWPAMVLLFGKRHLALLCGLFIFGAFAFRLGITVGDYPSLAAYALTPARMDALAVGALLAVAIRTRPTLTWISGWAWPVLILSGAGLSGIFLWRQGFGSEDLVVQTLGYSLLAALYGAVVLIAITASPGTRLSRLFSHWALRLFGRYSYGLYVVHHPIVLLLAASGFSAGLFPTVFNSELPGLAAFSLVAGSVSLSVAAASWHLYESRFLKLKTLFPYRTARGDRTADRATIEGEVGHATNYR